MSTQQSTSLANGRYELLLPLGSGGSGDVWRALDTHLQVERAIKILRGAPTPEASERQKREARLLAGLENPHIVTIFDSFEEDNSQCIVMELCEENLTDRVRRDGPLSDEETVSVGIQVLSALETAHDAGIVHRDIKPHNLLVNRNGQVKLADFGLAWVHDDPESLTKTGAVLGTIAYMSPEQRKGEASTRASDLYSLAATLFFLRTGQVPGDLYVANSWTSLTETLSPGLIGVLSQAGKLTAAERFESASAMRHALATGHGLRLEDADFGALFITRASRLRRLARPMGVLGLVLLVGILGVGFAWQSKASIGGPFGQTVDPQLAAQIEYLQLPSCLANQEGRGAWRFPDSMKQPPGPREGFVGAFGDLDQDGYPDLYVAHLFDQTIRIFWGREVPDLYPDFLDVPTVRLDGQLSFGDLDGDGHLDLVATDQDQGSLIVHWGEGGRKFSGPQSFEESGMPHAVDAGDWNGDGQDELLFVSAGPLRKSGQLFMRATQPGRLLAPYDSVAKSVSQFRIANFDGVPGDEIYALDSEISEMKIYTHQAGRPKLIERVPLPMFHYEITSLMLQVSEDGQSVGIWNHNRGIGAIRGTRKETGWEFCSINGPKVSAMGDFDGDGKLDVLTLQSGSYLETAYLVEPIP